MAPVLIRPNGSHMPAARLAVEERFEYTDLQGLHLRLIDTGETHLLPMPFASRPRFGRRAHQVEVILLPNRAGHRAARLWSDR
jgi:hypothetical protein